jgi:hypothetical protein
MKITIVDTKFNEMKQYRIDDFSLNFIIGRDIPNIVVILSDGKDHKAYCLNDVFKGSGCSINTFQSWIEDVMVGFLEEEENNYES